MSWWLPGGRDKSLKFFEQLLSGLLSRGCFSDLGLLKSTLIGSFHFFIKPQAIIINQLKHLEKGAVQKKEKMEILFSV